MYSPVTRRFLHTVLRTAAALTVAAALAIGGAHLPAVHAEGGHGAVYSETNAVVGNQVLVFPRAADGALGNSNAIATGGTGTGTGLGSQGSVILSEDARLLFAVNAGSNDISVFAVSAAGLNLKARAPSGGAMPISLAVHDDLLYVLNAGGSGNITGFRVHDGHLSPIAGATQPLSSSAAGPAEVQFRPDGRVLLVTEKTTNTIDTYAVNDDGRAGPPTAHPSSGPTPFGFAFAQRNLAIVSEAANSTLSSYEVGAGGTLETETASLPDHQAAPCWVVVTGNGRYAYAANAHNGTISGLSIGHDGQLALLAASGVSAATGATSAPTDMALSDGSRVLYVLTGGANSISAFDVNANGSLTSTAGATGLPAGIVGLAAR